MRSNPESKGASSAANGTERNKIQIPIADDCNFASLASILILLSDLRVGGGVSFEAKSDVAISG